MLLLSRVRHVAPAARNWTSSVRLFQNMPAVLGESSDLGAEQVVKIEEEKQVKGKRKSGMKDHPEWSEHMATDSEATVKADSDSLHLDNLKELQDHSVEVIHEIHKETSVTEKSKVHKDAA